MAASALGVGSKLETLATSMPHKTSTQQNGDGPLAITMWDFSWLERRWSGAGYEDWDLALDELKLRGYDAVRIDAYPHLVNKDATATWELFPVWTTQDWGSPAMNRVEVQPNLTRFMEKCAVRDLKVARASFPELEYTFSNWENCGGIERDLSNLDVLDLHIWMAGGPFYEKVGYKYESFDST